MNTNVEFYDADFAWVVQAVELCLRYPKNKYIAPANDKGTNCSYREGSNSVSPHPGCLFGQCEEGRKRIQSRADEVGNSGEVLSISALIGEHRYTDFCTELQQQQDAGDAWGGALMYSAVRHTDEWEYIYKTYLSDEYKIKAEKLGLHPNKVRELYDDWEEERA